MSYYDTLGVAKTASPDEIKKAYRKLASQHHPDKGGDKSKFQEVEEAYRTLSDPQKRQQYDQPQPQGMHGFGGMPGGFHFSAGDFDLNDILGQVFGGQFRQGPTQRQQTQVFRTQVNVSLEDAYKGNSSTLRVQTPSGVKVINITIPRGLQDGEQMRYDNVLDDAILMVSFRVMPHLKYERRGHDLYCQQNVSVLDLIAGTTFEFTGLSGKTLEVKVPPKTQPYMQLKISGEGMPIQNTHMFGDQIILLKPFVPDIIDDEIVQSILRSKQTKKEST